MRTILQIMSEPYMPGYGYSLLRSEYRVQAENDKFPGQAAEEWLHAIHMVLTYPGWYPGEESPGIAVHDLYHNGDALNEDFCLFAEVLRRYVHLRGIS